MVESERNGLNFLNEKIISEPCFSAKIPKSYIFCMRVEEDNIFLIFGPLQVSRKELQDISE